MKKWLGHMKVSKKLSTGFLFITFLGIVIGVIGVFNLIKVSNDQQETYDHGTQGIIYSSSADVSILQIRTLVRDLYIYYDTDKDEYCKEISDELTTLESYLENYKSTIADSQDQKNYNTAAAAFETYQSSIEKLINTAKSGKSSAEYLAALKSEKGSAGDCQEKLEALAKYKNSFASEKLASDKTSTWIAIYIMLAVIAISVALAFLLSRYISGMISKPMQMLGMVSEHLAVGDVDIYDLVTEEDKKVKYRKDEIGEVALAFNNLIDGTVKLSREAEIMATGDLTAIITVRSEKDILGKALFDLKAKFHDLAVSIVTSANQVDSGAMQVADASTALSQGATEQASSVEELSASMEEITSQTEQNAQNAQKTNALAASIQTDADDGNAQMAEMLRAMEEINASSENISKIIKVIDDIAFQTNILALNAAVEAARAGESGKGFAVVAEEVRNLAAKSAQAASETTALIETSIKKVETGTNIAKETAGALRKIVEGVSQAGELVNSIATASQEQTTALEQINQGISEISQVVQNNAASAEESAAASEELSAQADSLKEYVNVFKLDTEENSSVQTESTSSNNQQLG